MEKFAIGVDLGGSNLRIGAYTESGKLLVSTAFSTNASSGHSRVIDKMCETIRRLKAEAGEQRKFAGIGIGSPGPLSLPDGVLHNPPNLPGWDGVELRREVAERLNWPVMVDSDANVAALAEYRLGAGKKFGVDSLCMITLGTGVGGGIVLDERLWHGVNGAAGEVGHGPLIPNGPACNCGAHGCLELYASATAMIRRAGELSLVKKRLAGSASQNKELLTAAHIAKLAFDGDSIALQVYKEAGYALGIAIANLINVLNLPLYTIGGGVSGAWDLFAPSIFETLKESSYVYRMSHPKHPSVFEAGKTHVCRAQLGSDAGLLGAAMLPLQDSHEW